MDIDKLKEELKRDEGYRDHVYRCTTGHKTIGYGHMDDSMPDGTTCTRERAEKWLEWDIAKAILTAKGYISGIYDNLSDARQRALVNLAFNMGGRIHQFRRMRAAIMTGDWEKAADELLDSLYAKQVGDRAKRVAAMLREG